MFKILEVLGKKHYPSGCKSRTVVWAQCLACGTKQEMLQQNVAKSNRLRREHCSACIGLTFHRMTGTRIYRIWHGLRYRANDQLDKNYGGRGITVCQEWESFEQFFKDMYEGYSDDLTIERIDVNKPYCKENCRWASNMEQQSNKRNNRYVVYQGEKIHLAELVRRSGVSKMKLVLRLNRGMSADQAVKDAMDSGYGKNQRPVNVRRRERRMSTTL